jgi:hypothetical protein
MQDIRCKNSISSHLYIMVRHYVIYALKVYVLAVGFFIVCLVSSTYVVLVSHYGLEYLISIHLNSLNVII